MNTLFLRWGSSANSAGIQDDVGALACFSESTVRIVTVGLHHEVGQVASFLEQGGHAGFYCF